MAVHPYEEMAHSYLNLGLSPIPISRRDKTPMVGGYHGRQGKWVKEDDINRWLDEKRLASANIAIRLPKDIICLDVDDYEGHGGGATLAELEGELGVLPDTIRSTARWHEGISGIKWFSIPEDYLELEWPGTAGTGIDIICWYERYCIVSPSVHANGSQYGWYSESDESVITHLDTMDDLPELPEAWCEYLAEGPVGHDRVEVADVAGWLRANTRGEECEQMVATRIRWASELDAAKNSAGIHEAGRDGVKAVLGDSAAGHTGGWDALWELKKLFMSAVANRSRRRQWNAKTEWQRFVSGGVALAAAHWSGRDDPCAELNELTNNDPVRRLRAAKLIAGRHNGTWLDQQRFRPLTFAVDKILPEGLTIVVGAPKIGKSTLIRKMTLEVARGGEMFGLSCRQMPTFWLALEDVDRTMQDRCWELLGDDPIPEGFEYQLMAKPGKLVETIAAWLDEVGTGLVAVDTLGRAMERPQQGETQYDRDYRIMVALKLISDSHPGSFVLVTHHARKSVAEDWIEMTSGTNAITGGADTVIGLSRKRGSAEGVFRLTSREIDDEEFGILLERPFGWHLDGDDLLEAAANFQSRNAKGEHTLGDRSSALIEYVHDHEEGVTADEVSAELGISVNQAKVYLNRNANAGHIRRLKRGVYGPAGKATITPKVTPKVTRALRVQWYSLARRRAHATVLPLL